MAPLRWGLRLLVGLACVLVPACASTERKAPPEQAAAPTPGGDPARPAPALERPPSPAPKKTPAATPARRHPFAQALDAEARRAQRATGVGPLELRGILQGETRVALIQEGQKMHIAREGDVIGGLTLLEIRDGEVVLGAGPRKRILPLYAP